MKKYPASLIVLLFLLSANAQEHTDTLDRFRWSIRGYVTGLPLLRLDEQFSSPVFMQIFHQRLNWMAEAGKNIRVFAEARNRLLYSTEFRDMPDISRQFDDDPGMVDLWWVWLKKPGWYGHLMTDRLFLEWSQQQWQIRAGRQRINWGINLMFNPHDLFNAYSFFDFDYPERPGADALRVQYFFGPLSRIQLAAGVSSPTGYRVAALMFNHNVQGYDLQFLGGLYQKRPVVGAGWAGRIHKAGFKGEISWYLPSKLKGEEKDHTLVAAVGMDYMTGRGTVLNGEILYNGGFRGDSISFAELWKPMTPDNLIFSKYAVAALASHPLSPIHQIQVSAIYLPDLPLLYVSPAFSWNIATRLDVTMTAQWFIAGRTSVSAPSGSLWMAHLKYSFGTER